MKHTKVACFVVSFVLLAASVATSLPNGFMPGEVVAKKGHQHGVERITIEGEKFLSHGEDTLEENPEFATRPMSRSTTSRSVAFCEGNGQSGPRVQVVYAAVEGGVDRYEEQLGKMRQVANEASALVDTNAQMMGGRRLIRYVTGAGCEIEVMKTTISKEAAQDFWQLVDETISQGFKKPDRKYMFFVEHDKYCGYATTQSDDTPNPRVHAGNSYGIVGTRCWNPTLFTHELFHELGAVQRTAPHATTGYHCIDEHDLMCYSDAKGVVMQTVCPDQGFERVLDCGNDDYFSINPPVGSYLATHWNTADSLYLDDPLKADDAKKDKKKKGEKHDGKKDGHKHAKKDKKGRH